MIVKISTVRSYSRRDYLRQDLEQSLAALIADFEAQHNIAVYSMEIERDDRDEAGSCTSLKRYPLRQDPHAPLTRVRVAFAQGQLVSATMDVEEAVEPEPTDSTEPAETIEEECLRLAQEADLAAGVYESEGLVMTQSEALLYGGRYA